MARSKPAKTGKAPRSGDKAPRSGEMAPRSGEIPQLRAWQHAGLSRIAGIDEVGRGPLAGPVVAAAVILPEGPPMAGLADSKELTARRREELAEILFGTAEIGIATATAAEIDELNIHGATLLAMRRALKALPRPAEAALVDGKFVPPGLTIPAAAVIGGDARIAAISAASIIAKVTRDAMMVEAEKRFPGYGFARNAGYPAPLHKTALAMLGLTRIHRLSYAPCRAIAPLR